MQFHFPSNVLWTNGIQFVSVFPGNNLFLCFACLFNYFFLFMQLAERLWSFVHYVNHNTVICIAVSISGLDFGQRLYFGLWLGTPGKPLAWQRAATCSLVERVAPGTVLAAHRLPMANQSPVSNIRCKALHGLRPGCLLSYIPPNKSWVRPKAFLPTGRPSLTLLPFRTWQGIALVNVCLI